MARPGPAKRMLCYCKDCQAFANFLQGAEWVLDGSGGTAIVATRPGLVHFSQGLEALACMSLSEQGMFRWYASCCNTPIGNTPRDPRMSYVGLVQSCLGDDTALLAQSFGAVRMQLNTGDAWSPVASSGLANVVGTLGLMASVLGARLSGAHKQNPFFDLPAGTPLRQPRVLSEAERAQLTPTRS